MTPAPRDQGQGALQATASPEGQTVGSPAAQALKLQPCAPAAPPGQRSTQLEPLSQTAWQLPSVQTNSQRLLGPQRQVPFAHSPSHWALSPAQSTWQGPALQDSAQTLP
jgi:hypothetical protein